MWKKRDKLEKQAPKPNTLKRLFHRGPSQTSNTGLASSGSSLTSASIISNVGGMTSPCTSTNPEPATLNALDSAYSDTIIPIPGKSNPTQASGTIEASLSIPIPITNNAINSIPRILPPPISLQNPIQTPPSLNAEPANSATSSQVVIVPVGNDHPKLWSKAFEMLGDEDQKCILKIQPKGVQPFDYTIKDLLDRTVKIQKKCTESSFKFTFLGKEIFGRDMAGKIFFWLNKFKDVGDIAVNFDPIHAALPWAGFRFLLEVRQNC